MTVGAGSVAGAIRAAATRLAATSGTARLDAELLMAHALGVSRSDLLLRHMGDAPPADFAAMVDRRAEHEPVAYITGEQEFYGLTLDVAPGVLIPRGDSETLIEAAREAFAGRPPPARIIDLGTGSGALLLAAMTLFPEADGVATDKSVAVMAIVRRNIERHAQDRNLRFDLADWREEGWAESLGLFDLVLCNPPYVEEPADLDSDVRDFEPGTALFAGEEGLDDYRIVLPQLRGLMARDGAAILEIGAGQAAPVSEIARSCGFRVELRRDLANRPRCVVLR